MNFALALEQLMDGRRVARSGWNGKGMWIALHKPDEGSKMTEPFLFMRTAQGGLIPWTVSQADVLAHDWELVE